jgi:hypothetical protein
LADGCAFNRAVVNEHQRIHSKIQGFGYRSEIVGFRLPVCDKHRNILELEFHLRMLFKRFLRIGYVVLRTDRKDHSLPFQPAKIFLESNERLTLDPVAQPDPCQSVFADDSAP